MRSKQYAFSFHDVIHTRQGDMLTFDVWNRNNMVYVYMYEVILLRFLLNVDEKERATGSEGARMFRTWTDNESGKTKINVRTR